MANQEEKKLWFGNKKYGYGWVPNSIQGWISTGVYGLYVVVSTIWLSNQHAEPQETYILLYTLGMLISTGILVGLAKVKGTKGKWRWRAGSKDE